jgi:hypothetical protein
MKKAAPKKPTTAQRRKEAEHKVATLAAHAEAVALEKTIALMESPQPVVVPWTEYPAFDQFNGWYGISRPYYWSNLEDRQGGRYRPLYETDMDLRSIRAAGRRLKSLFPVAAGALEALTNYTIKGLEVKVQPKKKLYAQDPKIAEAVGVVQRLVDEFLEWNNFANNLDRESHSLSREEGEVFMALYPDGDNPRCRDQVRLEFIDPDYILAPLEEQPLNRHLGCSHKLNYWDLGVHTQFNPVLKRDDTARPLGYHAVYDQTGEQWDYLSVSRVEHIKRNVGMTGRRGVSDFYIVLQDIEAEAKVRRNTAEGAAILAAIVMIREHAEGTSRRTVENMVSGNSTGARSQFTPNGISTVNQQQVAPGTIKDTPFGMKTTVGPMGTLNQPIYIEVAQFLLRTIWQRWNAPEYMSGDASNANYSSTLVAESPFVRGREADQLFYGSHYERLLWKAMGMFQACGKLPYSVRMLMQFLAIRVSMASPASRDPLVSAQSNEIMHEAGVLSKRTWQIDAGLDPDEETEQIAKEPKPEPKQPSSPFRMFGAPKLLPSPKKEHIEQLPDGKFRLLSHDGENLGTFDSLEAAQKHEAEVIYFKSKESLADRALRLLEGV